MNTCKYCGKPLTLTPEYDICMECQGRIMRESTIPQGAFATNSTQQMITHGEAREIALAMLPKQVGSISSRNKVRNYFQLDLYFKQQEVKDQAHEELVRDVKRFIELYHAFEEHGLCGAEADEFLELETKLEGKENV